MNICPNCGKNLKIHDLKKGRYLIIPQIGIKKIKGGNALICENCGRYEISANK